MWALKILNGEQAGQVFALSPGKVTIGRSPECQVRLLSNGISKLHAELEIVKDSVTIKDLNSSNGTVVNGSRIKSQLLRLGDKIAFNDIFAELTPLSAKKTQPVMVPGHPAPTMGMPMQQPPMARPSLHHPQMHHPQMHHMPGIDQGLGPSAPLPTKNIVQKIENYVEQVMLPGIYKLPEVTEFKFVIGGFIAVIALLTTLLAMIPMVRITSDSTQQESQRRALSIARSLAAMNQQAILAGSDAALTTQLAELEDGVEQALILSQADGSIMAPATRIGNVPNLPFVHNARRENRELVSQIDSALIGASVPIHFYNTNTGVTGVKAHAVVLYNMGALAIDNDRTINLFIQTLFIAGIIGLIVFYFLYKLVEHPINWLNKEIDLALRERRDQLSLNLNFPAFQALLSNINTILTRAIHGSEQDSQGFGINKSVEAENLLQLIGYPGIAFNTEMTVIGTNQAFESLTGLSGFTLKNNSIAAIPDQALQKNIADLIERAEHDPAQLPTNELEFSGENCILSCQAICNSNSVEYFIVTIVPLQNVNGGAA